MQKCRNNVKFKGISESVQVADLNVYLHQLLRNHILAAINYELTIKRAHRLPTPKFLAKVMPRDIIAKIHFFHIKEQAMIASRKETSLTGKFKGVTLFANLLQFTIQARRKMSPNTQALSEHQISYK